MHEPVENLIQPDEYQVFLMTSPASVPFNFARHLWFVVNKKGSISRWEVLWKPEPHHAKTVWGHLTRDTLPPFQGLRVFHLSDQYFWRSSLFKIIEGDETSVAAQMAEYIEQSPQTYPYKERYSFSGPNSNTYVKWVIDRFPKLGIHLPWNAFGKDEAARAD